MMPFYIWFMYVKMLKYGQTISEIRNGIHELQRRSPAGLTNEELYKVSEILYRVF